MTHILCQSKWLYFLRINVQFVNEKKKFFFCFCFFKGFIHFLILYEVLQVVVEIHKSYQ